MRKILEHCPSCHHDLEVTQLSCLDCDTVIAGHFIPTRFSKLSPDNLSFAELFIQLRGNIKDMEREMGISYPTVRGRLNEVIRELGFDVVEAETVGIEDTHTEERRIILTQLKQGKINVSDAVEMLKKYQP